MASVMYPAFQMTTMWLSSTRDPQSSTSPRIQVSFWASAQLAVDADERIRRHRLRDGRWHSGVTSVFLVFLWETVLRFMSHIALFFGFSNSRFCGMWGLPHRYAHSEEGVSSSLPLTFSFMAPETTDFDSLSYSGCDR